MAPKKFIPQAAAIPFRIINGRADVLMIRKVKLRDVDQWGIPKGLVDPGCTEREAALIEAHEEAGVFGELLPDALGEFRYEKFRGICRVVVFGMRVTKVCDDYDERAYRDRAWFTIARAQELAARKDVGLLIGELARRLSMS